jgi:hypothetical protein
MVAMVNSSYEEDQNRSSECMADIVANETVKTVSIVGKALGSLAFFESGCKHYYF